MLCSRSSELAIDGAHGHALPGDKPRWTRDRVADVRHIALDLDLDLEAGAVFGTATHTVAAINDGLQAVPFDAIEMTINAVTVDGKAATWDYSGATLVVSLPRILVRGEAVEVAIAYRATPRIGLYFIRPDAGYPDKPVQVWSQCQDEDTRYWIPCYDAPNQKQTTELTVRVPGTWFALSNGRLVRETDLPDGRKLFHWTQERPHSTYLITLAAGEFARIDASRPSLTIDYYVEAADIERGKLAMGNTPAMIAAFEEFTGIPYPWAKYSQIVVRDFVFGGMENTSATTMTTNLLVDERGLLDYKPDELVSHELAHMWFGDLLTCRDWSHGWLNESFATYLELVWDERFRGVDEYRQGVIDNTNLYLEERYRRPIVSNVFRDPIDIFDRHLYEKGSVVIHMLRCLLGEDAFSRSVKRYCREHQEQNVKTQDLIDAIEAETGRNLEWFFDQWVFKPGHPELKVSWSWDAERKAATVTVRQAQDTSGATPLFRLPVTIDFRSGRGRPQAFRVEVTEAEHVFHFALQKRPDLCRFDPYNTVLKTVEFEKPLTELKLQLREDDDIAGRRLASEALGKKGGPEAIAALEEALRKDPWWSVSAAAAKALGTTKDPAAKAALRKHLGAKHPKVRRAVVSALAEHAVVAELAAALTNVATADESSAARGAAYAALGKLRQEGAFERLVEGMGHESFRQFVRNGCIDGFVELRDERAFDQLAAAAAYGTPVGSRGPALAGIAKLAAWFPARKAWAGEAIAKFLDDPDFRVRVAAANALKTLKDPSHAPALDRMAARELDGRAVRAAREAALALRRGDGDVNGTKALQEQIEALRNDNAKLRERVEKLEQLGPVVSA
ncbi:MAG: M1 family aminopeptidase [Dehalococcoidia bacterium]